MCYFSYQSCWYNDSFYDWINWCEDTSRPASSGPGKSGEGPGSGRSCCGWLSDARPAPAGAGPSEGSSGPESDPDKMNSRTVNFIFYLFLKNKINLKKTCVCVVGTLMSSMKVMSSLWMGFWVQTSAVYDLVFSSSPSFIRLMASLHMNASVFVAFSIHLLSLTESCRCSLVSFHRFIFSSPGYNLQVSHSDFVWGHVNGLKTKTVVVNVMTLHVCNAISVIRTLNRERHL